MWLSMLTSVDKSYRTNAYLHWENTMHTLSNMLISIYLYRSSISVLIISKQNQLYTLSYLPFNACLL